MVWADRSVRSRKAGQFRLALAVTFVLGIIFLAIQVIEYSRKGFAPDTNAYGSLFYTITGLHGSHVFIGLLMLSVIQVRAWLGHFGPRRHLAVQNVAMYWHFVDAVWLVVFTSIYLVPYVSQ